MISTANRRMFLIAALILALDQATKNLVLQSLGPRDERIVIDGFFRLVNWSNTGAAWSLFPDRNEVFGRPSTPEELAFLASDEAPF